jgi:hypothetical protein
MLVLLDRAFDNAACLAEIAATGAVPLVRAKSTRTPLVLQHLPDGSYLSCLGELVVPMEVVLSAVMGFMTGVVQAAKFLRNEIAGMVEPRLEDIEQQLHNLRAETNLDAATRLTALSKLLEDRHPHELPDSTPHLARTRPRQPGRPPRTSD